MKNIYLKNYKINDIDLYFFKKYNIFFLKNFLGIYSFFLPSYYFYKNNDNHYFLLFSFLIFFLKILFLIFFVIIIIVIFILYV